MLIHLNAGHFYLSHCYVPLRADHGRLASLYPSFIPFYNHIPSEFEANTYNGGGIYLFLEASKISDLIYNAYPRHSPGARYKLNGSTCPHVKG
ncbi:hypothetical protein CDAR_612131 [Caerostris darwini]|uniref:Uncharacterized protein n=1 Tax=Caerostris darwini TaxID=1538125 RepID=A0AAV4RYG3_9ARAC|nr:hypothetical protein CDAR_612131 [Caerostris darwini]